MGSPESEASREADEGPQRKITVNGFWTLETEVTVGMWRSFVKATDYKMKSKEGFGYNAATNKFEYGTQFTWESPGFPQTDEHPVTQVDWNGAKAFCAWLAEESGLPIRLPSEAEWEYACRAGTKTAYSFGLDAEELTKYGNVADDSAKRGLPRSLTEYWSFVSSDDDYVFTAPVKQFKPNAWNLYDMHGNVLEWCEDCYAAYDDTKNDQKPVFVTEGSNRVLRGGSWDDCAGYCRSAIRDSFNPANRGSSCGFRLVLGREL
ncbi:MAG: formylglycine-generating enzyme family protein [Thermoguttaceae bacterium]|nr:formylglycine-generating enzyme family protein [Thermoguttaceae bacterium]